MERSTVNEPLPARLERALAPRGEVLEAYLFGSRARGQARPDSDIDVAVYVDEMADDEGHWGYRAELTTDLMAALGADDVDIDCLVEAGVLPRAFGKRFRAISGSRNVLVHGYLEVDLDLLVGMLSERLDDFEMFASHVEHWLAEHDDA